MLLLDLGRGGSQQRLGASKPIPRKRLVGEPVGNGLAGLDLQRIPLGHGQREDTVHCLRVLVCSLRQIPATRRALTHNVKERASRPVCKGDGSGRRKGTWLEWAGDRAARSEKEAERKKVLRRGGPERVASLALSLARWRRLQWQRRLAAYPAARNSTTPMPKCSSCMV